MVGNVVLQAPVDDSRVTTEIELIVRDELSKRRKKNLIESAHVFRDYLTYRTGILAGVDNFLGTKTATEVGTVIRNPTLSFRVIESN